MNDTDKIKELVDSLIALEEDKMNGWTHTPYTPMPSPTKKKKGRPKKSEVASGLGSLNVHVVGNGYMITTGDGASNMFVFKNLDEATAWMKDNMRPTYKNSDFMEAL